MIWKKNTKIWTVTIGLITGLASARRLLLGIMAPGLFLGSRSNLEILLPLQPRLVGNWTHPRWRLDPIIGMMFCNRCFGTMSCRRAADEHVDEHVHISCRCVSQKRWSNMQLCLSRSIHAYIFIVGTQHVHLTASSDLQSRQTKWLPKSRMLFDRDLHLAKREHLLPRCEFNKSQVPAVLNCFTDTPSWELTYPISRHFWRGFSFSQDGLR